MTVTAKAVRWLLKRPHLPSKIYQRWIIEAYRAGHRVGHREGREKK